MCAWSATHKSFSLLIGLYDVVHYEVLLFPAFCQSKRHFRWSDKLVVDTSVSVLTEHENCCIVKCSKMNLNHLSIVHHKLVMPVPTRFISIIYNILLQACSFTLKMILKQLSFKMVN